MKYKFFLCKVQLIVAILLCVPVAQTGFAKGTVPAWINGRLNNEQYLGVATDRRIKEDAIKAALNNARVSVLESIGVKLSSKVDAEQLMQELTRNKDTTSIVRSTFHQRLKMAAASIVRIKSSAYYTEEVVKELNGRQQHLWNAYVLVIFSKAEHHRFLEDWTNRIKKDIGSIMLRAKKRIHMGDLIGAVTIACQVMDKSHALDGIGGVTPEMKAGIQDAMESARSQVQAWLDSLQLIAQKKKISDLRLHLKDEDIRVATLFQGHPGHAGLPLSVNFIEGQGMIAEDCKTEHQGVARIHIKTFVGHSRRYVLLIQPDLPCKEFTGQLTIPDTRIVLFPMPGRVAVSIEGEGFDRHAVSPWKRGIKSALLRRGFIVLGQSRHTKTDYRLNVTLNPRLISSKANSKRATLEADFQLQDAKGNILWTWHIPDTRFHAKQAFGTSKASALTNAVKQQAVWLIFEWIAASIEHAT